MSNSNTLIARSNQTQLESILKQPPHAIIVVGRSFSNHNDVAHSLANRLTVQADLISYTAPTIDEIRELRQLLRTKSASRRVVVIESAHQMKLEAQNALLKQLEEPTAGAIIVLASATPNGLIDTIQSRCRMIELATPTVDEYINHFGSNEPSEIKTAYLATNGNFQGIRAYLDGENDIARQAKEILSAKPYERMSYLPKYEKQRADAITLVTAIENILRYLIKTTPPERIQGFSNRLEIALETHQQLDQNGNVKLLLARLFSRL